MREDEKELWMDVFHDDEAFLSSLEKERTITTYRHEEKGRLVAALHLFPIEIVEDGTARGAFYLVGAATRAEYRRRGLMGNLIAEARKEGEILLYPAVRGFYEKLGFISPVFRIEESEKKKPAAKENLHPDFDSLEESYENFFHHGCVRRDDRAWRETLADNRLVTYGNGYALISYNDGKLVESAYSDEEERAALLETAGAVIEPLNGRGKRTVLFGMTTSKENERLFIPEIY